jgi:hypothetical protein
MTGSIAAGFGGGFAIDMPVIGTLIGNLVGAGLAALVVARFPVSPAGGVAPIVAITPATRATPEHPDGQTIRPSAGTGKSSLKERGGVNLGCDRFLLIPG